MEEFKEALTRTRTMILPFGTVEEHGRHLPLSTDTLIPVEILRRLKRDVFVAPPLHYGVCTSTRQHPGTITLSPETLRRFTRDILREAYRKGLRCFLLLSGHGGGLHISCLKEVAEELVEEFEDIRVAVVSPYEMLSRELAEIAETENDSHAGEIETSLVLALRPMLVKGSSDEEYPSFPKPLVVREKLRYWPGGVWGNPAKASAEKGERVIEIVLRKVEEVLDLLEGGW